LHFITLLFPRFILHPMHGPAAGDPFRMPFLIENNNPILPMNNFQVHCYLNHLIFENQSTVGGFSISTSSGNDHIPPKSQANYFCDVGNFFRPQGGGGVSSTEIYVFVYYKTPIIISHLAWDRRFRLGPFSWRSGNAGNQWIEGPIIR
jgi:hypothetical protein